MHLTNKYVFKKWSNSVHHRQHLRLKRNERNEKFLQNSSGINPWLSYKCYAIFITHSLNVPTFLESLPEIFEAKLSSDIDSEFIFFI